MKTQIGKIVILLFRITLIVLFIDILNQYLGDVVTRELVRSSTFFSFVVGISLNVTLFLFELGFNKKQLYLSLLSSLSLSLLYITLAQVRYNGAVNEQYALYYWLMTLFMVVNGIIFFFSLLYMKKRY